MPPVSTGPSAPGWKSLWRVHWTASAAGSNPQVAPGHRGHDPGRRVLPPVVAVDRVTDDVVGDPAAGEGVGGRRVGAVVADDLHPDVERLQHRVVERPDGQMPVRAGDE